jgi:hypothetical protein
MIRECAGCSASIAECMGLVKASDFMDAVNGLRPWTVDSRVNIRELCGKCGLRWIWNGDTLVARDEPEA